MATITSAATGNWSAGATWVGGVVPSVNDDAVIGAGHTVTLDVDVTVLTLSGAANTTSNLSITTSRTFTCTGANGITAKPVTSGGGLVRITGVGITVNINSNLRAVNTSSTGSTAINISSVCTVNITGLLIVNMSGSSLPFCLNIAAAANVNVIGDVYGQQGTSTGTNFGAIAANNSCILNVTGDLYGGNVNLGQYAISNLSTPCTINISGNSIASAGAAISSNQNSNINITGNCTSANATAITATTTSTTVVGTITASNSAVGINVGSCTISTPCINSANGVMAVLASTTKIYSTSVASWQFRDESNNIKNLYSAGVALGNPATTDVRNGTTYGASSELTGSLIMAIPANVRRGVNTDATVGTADLTAQDIFTEIASSSDPIAVRLRNIATVQTTGAQLASYN
jgi:hypothetical protein